MVSVFLSNTVRPAASKTVKMTVIILARPSADLDIIPASSAYSMLAGPSLPRRDLLKVLLEVNQIPNNVWVLTEAFYHGVCHSSE